MSEAISFKIYCAIWKKFENGHLFGEVYGHEGWLFSVVCEAEYVQCPAERAIIHSREQPL